MLLHSAQKRSIKAHALSLPVQLRRVQATKTTLFFTNHEHQENYNSVAIIYAYAIISISGE